MTRSWVRKFAITASVVVLSSAASAAQTEDSTVTGCKALEAADFSGIQDAPTQVMESELVEAAGELPAHCMLRGYIWPQVGFVMKLPLSAWNGKFLEHGLGGLGGVLRDKLCDDSLRRGYACITTDTGHTGTDGMWAYQNLQAKIDYGFRATHVAALAGRAIAERYYGNSPKYSYFMGCSGGGRQALVEAQEFPYDFDGIIAMDPGINITEVIATINWNAQALTDKDGQPLFTSDDLELLHKAAVTRCDMDDGVNDGVIGNPPACRIDPAELTCKRQQRSGCLSLEQVTAARKVYGGPVNSAGAPLFVGRSMPGAELGGLGPSLGPSSIVLVEEFFRYMAFLPDPGPNWRFQEFDFDRNYKRLDIMQALYVRGNPDLRRFRAAGGKLMIVQGWDDSGSPLPLNTIDYYEMVARVMGGREKTQEFARLFMMPGRAHCARGPGANAFDFLGYLEAWVERGQEPALLIGAHVEDGTDFLSDMVRQRRFPENPAQIKFTRPVYPYPLRAIYKGTGDPTDWRNFKAVDAPVDWESLSEWQNQLSK